MALLFLEYLVRNVFVTLLIISCLSGCDGVFFYPAKEMISTPSDAGLSYEDVSLPSFDGTKLSAWIIKGKEPLKGTILFLHGNAQNMSYHLPSIAWLPAEGFNMISLDYRGYGNSAGSPSVRGAIEDVKAGIALLKTQPVKPYFVFGQSIGGSLSITALEEETVRSDLSGLIVDGAFESFRGIAREKLQSMPILSIFRWPASLLISSSYDPIDRVELLSPLPTLFIWGGADEIVPSHHTKALFERAKPPKGHIEVEGAQHIQALYSKEARKKLLEFLTEHTSKH